MDGSISDMDEGDQGLTWREQMFGRVKEILIRVKTLEEEQDKLPERVCEKVKQAIRLHHAECTGARVGRASLWLVGLMGSVFGGVAVGLTVFFVTKAFGG